MNPSRRRNLTLALFTLLVAFVAILSGNLTGLPRVAYADPVGIKYTGAGTCATAACHGAVAPKPLYDGDCQHNENTIWSTKDLHSQSFSGEGGKRGLVNALSKEIAKKLKIADSTKSERCLSCHALSGLSSGESKSHIFLKPTDIAPAKYNIEDGVSCDSCHGPASKYMDKHTGKLWTQTQRKELGSQKLYDDWGLYDTKNLKFRANACLSCHLKIDHELIDAGHPELPFELDGYSQGEWIHWQDKGAWFSSKSWAMGQVVSLREAALQLADRIKSKAEQGLIIDSYKQTLAHAILARHVAFDLDKPSLDALNNEITTLNASWNEPDKVDAALHAISRISNALADTIEKTAFTQTTTESLLNGVAAEGDIAGNIGFRAAEQFTLGLKSLWGCVSKDAKPADAEARMAKVDELYEPLGEAASYDPKKFAPAAAKMSAVFPGGKLIPLPAGGPGMAGGAPAPVVARPPERVPETVVKAPENISKPEPVVKAPEKIAEPAPVQKLPEPTVKATEVIVPPVAVPTPPEPPPIVKVQPKPPDPVPAQIATPTAGDAGQQSVFCPECGTRWPANFKYCAKCGHQLPKL